MEIINNAYCTVCRKKLPDMEVQRKEPFEEIDWRCPGHELAFVDFSNHPWFEIEKHDTCEIVRKRRGINYDEDLNENNLPMHRG